jgi:hypothetical protein
VAVNWIRKSANVAGLSLRSNGAPGSNRPEAAFQRCPKKQTRRIPLKDKIEKEFEEKPIVSKLEK